MQGNRWRATCVESGVLTTPTLTSEEIPTNRLLRPAALAQAKPRPLRGTIAGNKVSLTAEFQATVNINGEESTRSMTVVYDFTMKGDALEGTMTNRNADVELPPLPFTAAREKP